MLHIYTATHCPSYQFTVELVRWLRQNRPDLPLELINLDQSGIVPPPSIIGTPIFTWNGQTIFWGNPSQAKLLERVDQLWTMAFAHAM